MPLRSPDHRGLRVRAAIGAGETLVEPHPFEESLKNYWETGVATEAPDIVIAARLYDDPSQMHVLNSLIVGKATNDQICEGLDMQAGTLQAYRFLFFDRDVFMHALDVHNYVLQLAIPDQIREYYSLCIQKGPFYVINRFRIGERPPVDPGKVLKTLLVDQFDRALSHRGHSITSETARESRNWVKQTVQTAIAIKDDGGEERRKEEMKKLFELETTDRTKKLDDLGIKPEEVVTT